MLAAAVLIAGLSACSGKNDTGVDISGQWHLVETGDLIGEQGLDIDVYASFTSGTFVLYQKVGTGLGRYWYYEGTYTVSGDNVMTGRYSDGRCVRELLDPHCLVIRRGKRVREGGDSCGCD